MRAARTIGRRLPVVALGALLLSGCGNRAELVQFNDRIARAFQKLGEADKAFYDGVYDFAYNKAVPGGGAFKRFHEGYDRLKTTTAEVRKEAEALQVPDAPGAGKFRDSLLQALKVHEETLAEFGPAREAPERRALAQRTRLREMLDETQRRKRAAWEALDEAQKAFARENGIKLK
jgi:hypothetical protein